MKKRLLLLVVALILAGIGCSNKREAAEQNNIVTHTPPAGEFSPPINTDSQVVDAAPTAEELLKKLNENFKQHAFIPTTEEVYGERMTTDKFSQRDYSVWINDPRQTDCLAIESAYTRGGDLLSSLEGDNTFRNVVDIKRYSKTYIKDLKENIKQYTQSNYNKKLYAFYVCNLQNGVDLVAGNLWPEGRSPYDLLDDKMIKTVDEFDKYRTLLLVNNTRVYELKNVSSFTHTATGGETGPCNAKINKDAVLEWKCFAGLGEDKKTNFTYGTYNSWLISLDGNIIKNWTTRD